MIAWIHTIGEITHLVVYDSKMRKIADLIEDGDDWTILIGEKKMRVNGRGCSDPVDFLERMLNPGALIKARNHSFHEPWLMRFRHYDGETWEVWNAE